MFSFTALMSDCSGHQSKTLLFGLLLCLTNVFSRQFDYTSPLNTNSRLTLAWTIDQRREGALFQLCYNAEQTEESRLPDVVGIGFSDRGATNDADLLIFWKGKHDWQYQDCHTDHESIIRPDKEDNYKVFNIFRRRSQLCFEFQRLFEASDSKDYQIDTGTTHILGFSRLNVPPLGVPYLLRLDSLSPTVQTLQIIKSPIRVPPLPEDTKTFEMRVKNLEIPDVATTYWCKTAVLPKMIEKHHIIRYEGVISPTSVGIVHHMEVFHCEVPPNERIRHYDAPCNSETKPMGLTACRKVIGAWAMGASGFSFPKEAGYPIGGPGYTPYVVIEVHYNNPNRKKGLVDSSGIRFYLTSKLRPYDAGLMELGLEYVSKMSIPPRQKHFTLSGHCVANCTREAYGPRGIVVFGSQLHTHLTGERVITYHVRNNRRLADLNRDDHYSPHFQEIRLLQKMVYVHPGDALINSCTYNSLKRPNMTFVGLEITNEMCSNYIFYYPKIDLEVCKSTLADSELEAYFSYSYSREDAPTSPRQTTEENYSAIDWTDKKAEQLSEYYKYSLIQMSCNTSAGRAYPGKWNAIKPTILP